MRARLLLVAAIVVAAAACASSGTGTPSPTPTPTPGAPVITGVAPGIAAVGQSVLVTGSAFGASKGSSTIQFGVVVAVTSSWSVSAIRAAVPAGAPMQAPVTVTTTAGTSNAWPFTVSN